MSEMLIFVGRKMARPEAPRKRLALIMNDAAEMEEGGGRAAAQFQPSEFSAMTGADMSRPLELPVRPLPLEFLPLVP